MVADARRGQQVGLDGATDQLVAQEHAVLVLEREPVRRAPRRAPPQGPHRARRRRDAARSTSAAARWSRRLRTPRRRRRASSRDSGRPAGASSRSTRRVSVERTAIRARTRSSNVEVSDTVGSSRRAASSSSATSGRPPDRSTTTTRTLADGALPLDRLDEARKVVPAQRLERQAIRLARGALERPQVDGPGVVAADRIRLVRADDRERAGRGRCGRGRSRSVRVPASARCRSSITSRIGRRSPRRPRTPEDPLEQARLAALRHGGQGAGDRRRGSPGARPARA